MKSGKHKLKRSQMITATQINKHNSSDSYELVLFLILYAATVSQILSSVCKDDKTVNTDP